jgi:hypothetical protein
MTDDRHALRGEYDRQLFELRRLERSADAEVRWLDRRLRELTERHERTAHRLEDEYRRIHFGNPPPPPKKDTD